MAKSDDSQQDYVTLGAHRYPCEIDHYTMIDGVKHYAVKIKPHYVPLEDCDLGDFKLEDFPIEEYDPSIPFVSSFLIPCGGPSEKLEFLCPYCDLPFSSKYCAKRHFNAHFRGDKIYAPPCDERKLAEPQVEGKWLDASQQPKPVYTKVLECGECPDCLASNKNTVEDDSKDVDGDDNDTVLVDETNTGKDQRRKKKRLK